MNARLPSLGDFLLPVESASPASEFDKAIFKYVDISAVGREERSIRNPQFLTGVDAPSRARQLLAPDDVIVSTVRPNLNTVAFVTAAHGDAIASTGFCVLRANPARLNSRYLLHWVSSDAVVKQLVRQATGAAYPAVSDRIIKAMPFDPPLPPEQRRIAAILDKADSLRRNRQEAIRLADEFLRAVFIDVFGDPVANSKRLPIKSLEELCSVGTGATPSRERADFFGGPYPWIKTGEVDSGWITHAEESISHKALKETNCKLFPERTILVAMYGQGKTRGKVGMLGIAAATNQACAAILPSELIDPLVLYTQLTLMYEHLRAMARGGNQENLNLGMIKSLQVLVPPTPLVERFLAIRRRTHSILEKARAGEVQTQALANSLGAALLA